MSSVRADGRNQGLVGVQKERAGHLHVVAIDRHPARHDAIERLVRGQDFAVVADAHRIAGEAAGIENRLGFPNGGFHHSPQDQSARFLGRDCRIGLHVTRQVIDAVQQERLTLVLEQPGSRFRVGSA